MGIPLTIFKGLKRLRLAVNSWYWTLFLRLLGAQVGKDVTFGGRVNWKFNGDPKRIIIRDHVTFTGDIDLRNREHGSIVIESGCGFDRNLRLVAARESTITIGKRTQAGMEFVINAGADVTLGEDCLVSSFVHINGSGHPTFRDARLSQQGYLQEPVTIGPDVWLANCVNVAMGTVIEEGVIVGANSVISGHFPAYSLVMGNPGKVSGTRLYKDSKKNTAMVAADSTKTANLPLQPMPETKSGVLQDLTSLLKELKLLSKTPPVNDGLRRGGYLDSLNWIRLMDGIAHRYGDVIPDRVAFSPSLDSLESIADYLVSAKKPARQKSARRIQPAPYHLYEQISRLAEAQPEQPILRIKAEGGAIAELTYGTLISRAQRFAGFLKQNGFQAGDRLGLITPPSLDLAVAFTACLQIGVIPSIFAYPSAKVPGDIYAKNHQDMFSRIKLRGIYSTPELAAHLTDLTHDTVFIFSDQAWWQADPWTKKESSPLDSTAIIQHSSGTTGIQKGVAMTHEMVSFQVSRYGQALELRDYDVIVSWLPLYHDMGFIACFLLPLLTGVPAVLMSPFEWVVKPGMFFELCDRYRGTLAWMPNFAFELLADRVSPSELAGMDLNSVRALISCSEPVLAKTVERFCRTFAEAGLTPEKMWSCYAMAENVFAVTQANYYKAVTLDLDALSRGGLVAPAEEGHALVSQGRPVADSEIRILDDKGQSVPEGRVGEISLRSPCMLKEYHNNREATEAALQKGWYLTGDVGFIWEKELYVTGRKKDLIILAGRNFYPQDIEEIVSASGGIKPGRCAAFGRLNPATGTEDLVVVAEKDPSTWKESNTGEAAIKKAVFERLDCVISDLRFVDPGWIIKTSSGKINRKACQQKYTESLAQMAS